MPSAEPIDGPGEVRVVDDFYRDVDAVRRVAMSEDWDVGGGRYDKRSDLGEETIRPVFSASTVTAFERVLSRRIDYDLDRHSFGSFIRFRRGQVPRVHPDRSRWAGLVYLSEAPPTAGTSFHRHRETGLTALPDDQECRRMGFDGQDGFLADIVERDGAIEHAWEPWNVVEHRVNRLVLFDGRLFHRANSLDGFDACEPRLIQVFFFLDGEEHAPQATKLSRE